MRVGAAAAWLVVAGALWGGYPPGMGQQGISVAQAVELLRQQPQDAEMRVVEVIIDKDGNVVGHADSPATGVEFIEIGPLRYVQFVGARTAGAAPKPRDDH